MSLVEPCGRGARSPPGLCLCMCDYVYVCVFMSMSICGALWRGRCVGRKESAESCSSLCLYSEEPTRVHNFQTPTANVM